MKPIIILPPDAMSADDIKMLRDNGICVVVASNPNAVKFVDAIPAVSSRTTMEHAAIQLSRKLLAGELVGNDYKKNVAALYVDLLVKGTPLDPKPTKEEQEKITFDAAKFDEIQKIAREEAREEAAKKKAAKK